MVSIECTITESLTNCVGVLCPPKMKKVLVDDVHSDMMSVPLNNSPRDSVRAEHPSPENKNIGLL